MRCGATQLPQEMLYSEWHLWSLQGGPTATHHYLSQPKEDRILLFLNVSLVTGNTVAVEKKTI